MFLVEWCADSLCSTDYSERHCSSWQNFCTVPYPTGSVPTQIGVLYARTSSLWCYGRGKLFLLVCYFV